MNHRAYRIDRDRAERDARERSRREPCPFHAEPRPSICKRCWHGPRPTTVKLSDSDRGRVRRTVFEDGLRTEAVRFSWVPVGQEDDDGR